MTTILLLNFSVLSTTTMHKHPSFSNSLPIVVQRANCVHALSISQIHPYLPTLLRTGPHHSAVRNWSILSEAHIYTLATLWLYDKRLWHFNCTLKTTHYLTSSLVRDTRVDWGVLWLNVSHEAAVKVLIKVKLKNLLPKLLIWLLSSWLDFGLFPQILPPQLLPREGHNLEFTSSAQTSVKSLKVWRRWKLHLLWCNFSNYILFFLLDFFIRTSL